MAAIKYSKYPRSKTRRSANGETSLGCHFSHPYTFHKNIPLHCNNKGFIDLSTNSDGVSVLYSSHHEYSNVGVKSSSDSRGLDTLLNNIEKPKLELCVWEGERVEWNDTVNRLQVRSNEGTKDDSVG